MVTVVSDAVEQGRLAAESVGALSPVLHAAWVGVKDGFGGSDYAEPVLLRAVVSEGAISHKRTDGQVITTKARLTFLGPVPPNGAEGRQEPFDPRDLFTLPSGFIGKPLEITAKIVSPETNRPYLSGVWLA